MDRIQQLKNVTADSSLQDIQSSFGEDADGGDDSEGRHTLLDSLLEELQVQLQMKSFQSSLEATLDRKAEEAGEELEEEEEVTAAPDDIDAGECSEKPSQDPASNPDNSGEEEYMLLHQEKERLLKKAPRASQRTEEEKAELKKIYNRLGKIGKRKAVTVEGNDPETAFNSEEQRESRAAPDVGERKGWTHVCPLDQSQSEAPEKPSQDRSKLSSSQVEDEYLRLCRENETFLKEHPVPSQRSQEEKSRIQKIRNRMKKIRGQLSKGNSDTVRMTQSQGKGSSDRKELTGKRSRRNDGNENPDEGHETKR